MISVKQKKEKKCIRNGNIGKRVLISVKQKKKKKVLETETYANEAQTGVDFR